MGNFLKKYWPLLLIVLVAVFLRFYQLDKLPPGLYPDEAANGLDVIRMMDEGDFRVVYDTNGPREALFFYFQGFFIWLGKAFDIAALDFTPLSLRIAPALFGVATVFGVYLLAKELFNKNVGIFSAAAMAVSAWHIQFSRLGFRAIMLPFALSFMFYFFIKAYKGGKLKDYLWFAVFLGIGFYTYLSIRMVPLIFIALLIMILVQDRDFLKNNFKKLLYAVGVFLVIMIPMLIHFSQVPGDILGRSSTSIFNPDLNNGSAALTLFENIKSEIFMFNFSGDKNFRHNLGGSPMLDLVTGIFFWVGVVISLIKFRKIEHFLLITWFGAMSLPMILTAEGIPHALRLAGAMPVIFIWIGLGLEFLFTKIPSKKLGYGLITVLLLFATFFGFKKYFIDFAGHTEARRAYSEDMVEIANELNSAPATRRNILITGEFGTKTIQFITHGNKPKYERYEYYQVAEKLRLNPNENVKIYVQEDWITAVREEFTRSGQDVEFKEIKSKADGRVIYYVYES